MLKKSRWLSLPIVILSVLVLAVSVSGEDELLALANQKLLRAGSFRFDFDQVSVVTNMDEVLTSAGYMLYQAPVKGKGMPKIFMEYTEPEDESQMMVFDGKTLWTYRKNINQVVKHVVRPQDMKRNAMVFIPQWLDELLSKSRTKFLGTTAEGWKRYLLKPRNEAEEVFAKVELFMDPKDYELRKYVLEDKNGNLMKVTIRSSEYDLKIAPKKFLFTPPKGAEIMENFGY